MPVLVDPVLKVQNIEDQTADRHDVFAAGRNRFEALLSFGPESANNGFVRVSVERVYGGEGSANRGHMR